MFDERLFYYIHGIATMFFLLEGLRRFRNKKGERLNKICGYILLYWSVLEFKDLLLYPTNIIRETYLSNLLILFDITAVPAGCFFIIELLYSGWCTLRRTLWIISPFVLGIIAYAITAQVWVYNLFFIFVGIFSVCFLIQLPYAIRRYNRYLVDNYSNTEHINISWLKGVAVMLTICLVVWIYSCYHSSWIVDSIYQLVLMTMWALILFFADRQQTVQFTLPLCNTAQMAVESHSEAFPLNKLEEAMTKDQIWLNPHLTISDLASHIGTNRTYLSNCLNKTLNTTFYDYINHYRLEAALKHLDNPDSNITIAEIAESCGFNSLSTFRRVFMRAKGCTFAEYRQQITQKTE